MAFTKRGKERFRKACLPRRRGSAGGFIKVGICRAGKRAFPQNAPHLAGTEGRRPLLSKKGATPFVGTCFFLGGGRSRETFHVEQWGTGWGKKVSAICEKHLQRKKADDIIMSKPPSGTRRGEVLSGKRAGAGLRGSPTAIAFRFRRNTIRGRRCAPQTEEKGQTGWEDGFLLQIRKAGSVKRRPLSILPPSWGRPATARCWLTLTRKAAPPAG